MSTASVYELTIADIHEAYRSDELTCEAVVESCRERIEAYDRSGPSINAVVTVNERATDRARELDESFESTGEFVGPLHGIPILVKDQAETAGLETTFGSIAFEDYVPETNATIVDNLETAGAIVLAKTNMPDWASSWIGYSSVIGRTKNPYALDRDPGGSSSGTAAGVAANYAPIGIGEDTGGSIRVPAAFTNLFGIRVTTGLISRSGASPLVVYQDTLGPMARTVDDMTRLLDVLVGYDPDDEFTAATELTDVESYRASLDGDGLDGRRIGVLRTAFGPEDDPKTAPVTAVVTEAASRLEDAGATLVDPVEIPNLSTLIDDTVMYLEQSKHDLNGFIEARPDAPVDSIEAIYEAGAYHELLELFEEIVEDGPDDPATAPDYWRKVATRSTFQRTILSVFASNDLDALLYPSNQTLPPTDASLRAGEWDPPTNPLIAPQSNCPAVSMPAGLTDDGLPAGVELLGKPFDEPTLIAMAAAYEREVQPRIAPELTPPLDS